MPSMTTGTGIECPHCGHEVDITTTGILGGFFKQWVLHGVLSALARNGGRTTIRCSHCGKMVERRVAVFDARLRNHPDGVAYRVSPPFEAEAEDGGKARRFDAVVVSRSDIVDETMVFGATVRGDRVDIANKHELACLPLHVTDARALREIGYRIA